LAISYQMLVNTTKALDVTQIRNLRRSLYQTFTGPFFLAEFNDDSLGSLLPFTEIPDISYISDSLPRSGTWWDMNLSIRYVETDGGPGDREEIRDIIEWLQHRRPGCQI